MPLDLAHVHYLTEHHRGRLATVAPDGTPQNKPVGYRYNPELGTIDIAGFAMDNSAKYRNIAVHPQVSFVVDDAIGEGAAGMRFVELRGRAEQAQVDPPADDEEGLSRSIIRIYPRRVVSWNADADHPGLQTQTLAPAVGSGVPTDERPTLGTGGLANESAAVVAGLVAELQVGIDARDAEVYNRHFAADVIWGSPYGATVSGYDEIHAIHTGILGQPGSGSASRYETIQVLSPLPMSSSPMSAESHLAPPGNLSNPPPIPAPASPRWRSTSWSAGADTGGSPRDRTPQSPRIGRTADDR